MKNIDSFLKENKPQVKDNPTFLLEVQNKMRAVEGIKTEVDRQRRSGLAGIIATVVACVLAGVVCLISFDQISIALKDVLAWAEALIGAYSYHVMIAIAVCAVVLGLSAGRKAKYYNR